MESFSHRRNLTPAWGQNLASNFMKQGQSGSGMALYIREEIEYTILNWVEFCKNHILETIILESNVPKPMCLHIKSNLTLNTSIWWKKYTQVNFSVEKKQYNNIYHFDDLSYAHIDWEIEGNKKKNNESLFLKKTVGAYLDQHIMGTARLVQQITTIISWSIFYWKSYSGVGEKHEEQNKASYWFHFSISSSK